MRIFVNNGTKYFSGDPLLMVGYFAPGWLTPPSEHKVDRADPSGVILRLAWTKVSDLSRGWPGNGSGPSPSDRSFNFAVDEVGYEWAHPPSAEIELHGDVPAVRRRQGAGAGAQGCAGRGWKLAQRLTSPRAGLSTCAAASA